MFCLISHQPIRDIITAHEQKPQGGGNKIFNQQNALEFIAELTKRGTVSGVIEILSDYFLPHIGELNFLEKSYFIGYMVNRLLKVYTKEEKPTDRDNFRFKRVELSGSLIYHLFTEYYYINVKNKINEVSEYSVLCNFFRNFLLIFSSPINLK